MKRSILGLVMLTAFGLGSAGIVLADPAPPYSLGSITVGSYTLSGVLINPDTPSMQAAGLTGPANTTASVTVDVFFFSAADKIHPWGHATSMCDVKPNVPVACSINNGSQSLPANRADFVTVELTSKETVDVIVSVPVPGVGAQASRMAVQH